MRPRPGFSLKGSSEGIGGKSKLAGTSGQDAGVTYRPPMVNMNYFGGLVSSSSLLLMVDVTTIQRHIAVLVKLTKTKF